MTNKTIDTRRSLVSLRRGKGLVDAETALRGAASVADYAVSASRASGRMDASGALTTVGMRGLIGGMLGQAREAGRARFDGAAHLNDIMQRLAVARSHTPEGRLDDKSIGLKGSDRRDSTNPNAALAFARDLEYMTNEILREEGPVLSAKRLFQVDSSMPAGAKTYSIQKISHSGGMRFWKAGEGVPLVDVGRDKRSMQIAHAVIGMETDFFESQSDAYAGFNRFAEKVRASRQATAEFENIVFWRGAESHKLFGLLNFPWTKRIKLASALSTPTTDAQFETQAQLLSGFLNDIADRNPGMNMQVRIVWAPSISRQVAQSRQPSTQKSLLERFREDNPSVVQIDEAPELQAAGPGGEDGILVLPVGESAPVLVQPVPYTLLPVQNSNYGLTQTMAGYIAIGGARYKEALRSTVVWADRA